MPIALKSDSNEHTNSGTTDIDTDTNNRGTSGPTNDEFEDGYNSSSSFILVDDFGCPIDPAAEGSYIMAEMLSERLLLASSPKESNNSTTTRLVYEHTQAERAAESGENENCGLDRHGRSDGDEAICSETGHGEEVGGTSPSAKEASSSPLAGGQGLGSPVGWEIVSSSEGDEGFNALSRRDAAMNFLRDRSSIYDVYPRFEHTTTNVSSDELCVPGFADYDDDDHDKTSSCRGSHTGLAVEVGRTRWTEDETNAEDTDASHLFVAESGVVMDGSDNRTSCESLANEGSGNHTVDKNDSHESDLCEEEETRMSTLTSGLFSSGSSEWVLDVILRRRINREKEGGPWIYLCKWRGDEEPTWETREQLEDAGYIPQLDAYDARGMNGNVKTSTKCKQEPRRNAWKYKISNQTTKEEEEENTVQSTWGRRNEARCGSVTTTITRSARPHRIQSVSIDLIEEFFVCEEKAKQKACPMNPKQQSDVATNATIECSGSTTLVSSPDRNEVQSDSTDQRASDFVDLLAKELRMKIVAYSRMNPRHVDVFVERWRERMETHIPILKWHGTRTENISSIFNRSLLVGGSKGVQVSHGSLFGRGVYTASCRTAMSYAWNNSLVLLCVGLVPMAAVGMGNSLTMGRYEDESVLKVGDAVIFRDARDVCPLWCVHYRDLLPTDSDPKPQQVLLHSMLKIELREHERKMHEYQIQYVRDAYTRNLLASSDNPSHDGDSLAKKQRLSAPSSSMFHCLPLTDKELREVQRVLGDVTVGSGKGKGGFKKAALKAQPRRIKDLLARFEAEGRMK